MTASGVRGRAKKIPGAIDLHNHIGVSVDGTVGKKDELLSLMDANGIARSVIFAIDEEDIGDTYAHLNDAIMALVKEHPDRLIGFCRVQPKAGKAAVEEVERSRAMGCMGLKLHPRSENFLPGDCEEVLGAIEGFHWPVILHTDHLPQLRVEDWEKTLRAHPRVNFVLAHGGKDHWQHAAHVAITLPNVYLETSTLSYNRTRMLLERVGPQKIVFGSDYPYSHPYLEKKKYELLVEDERALELILAENAKKLLRL